MNFVTQLLPGLRYVRAPLIAGYLWLLAGWLLLAGKLPERDGTDVYNHVFEIGDMVGRIGLLGAVSVGAYLIGSLLQAVPEWIIYNFQQLRVRLRRISPKATASRVLPLASASQILNAPPIFAPTDFHWADGDSRTRRVLAELVNERLNGPRRDMETALNSANEKLRKGAEGAGGSTKEELSQATVAIEAIETSEQGWEVSRWGAMILDHVHDEEVKLSLPSFSANRDLFRERAAIETRLMETTQQAGSEVERLYSESQFRLTVAPPLATVACVLAAKSDDLWWLTLLGVVLGLLVHAVVLRKHAGRELAEALRWRPNDDELDQVTPIFARYEEDAGKVVKALADQNWESMGTLIKRQSGA